MVTQILSGLLSNGHDVDSAVEHAMVAVDKLLIALHTNKKQHEREGNDNRDW